MNVQDEKRVFRFDHVEETKIIFLSAVIIFITRELVKKHLIEPLSLFMLKDKFKGDNKVTREKLKANMLKFTKNCWNTVYYTGQTVVGLFILRNAEWMYDLSLMGNGFPHSEDTIQHPYLRTYVFVQMGYFVQAIFSLFFLEYEMKDFTQSLIHHLVSIVSIFLCITCGMQRFCSIVLVLHHVVDIFLYMAKSSHDVGYGKTSAFSFLLLMISYTSLRLSLLPYVLYSYTKEAFFNDISSSKYFFSYLDDAWDPLEVTSYGVCLKKYCLSPYYMVFGLMCVLVCLHLYWFYLILNIFILSINHGGMVGDIRNNDFTIKDEKEN